MRMEQNILILTVNEDTSSFENAPANNDKILPGAKETAATDSFWVTSDHLWVSVIDVT